MINIDITPCIGCVYFDGVKQPDQIETKEYLSCRVAKDGDAINVLKLSGAEFKCDFKKVDNDDG